MPDYRHIVRWVFNSPKIVRTIARKPCPVIVLLSYPSRHRAALMVLSDIGLSKVRILGKRKRRLPVSGCSSRKIAATCVESGTICAPPAALPCLMRFIWLVESVWRSESATNAPLRQPNRSCSRGRLGDRTVIVFDAQFRFMRQPKQGATYPIV